MEGDERGRVGKNYLLAKLSSLLVRNCPPRSVRIFFIDCNMEKLSFLDHTVNNGVEYQARWNQQMTTRIEKVGSKFFSANRLQICKDCEEVSFGAEEELKTSECSPGVDGR